MNNVFFSYTLLGGNMRLSDLQSKDIVNISDGRNVGNIIDVNCLPFPVMILSHLPSPKF